jgi:Hsp70 protein
VPCRSEITRDKFEELAAPVLERVRQPCAQALAMAQLAAGDIAAVEMCGAASRTPSIVATVADVFQQEPKRCATRLYLLCAVQENCIRRQTVKHLVSAAANRHARCHSQNLRRCTGMSTLYLDLNDFKHIAGR